MQGAQQRAVKMVLQRSIASMKSSPLRAHIIPSTSPCMGQLVFIAILQIFIFFTGSGFEEDSGLMLADLSGIIKGCAAFVVGQVNGYAGGNHLF